MALRETVIYGAGMSGMVAAYNLAREGHDVIVREQEGSYGGSGVFNPSTHTTPLDLEKTSEFIGMDISPAFQSVSSLFLYLHDFRIVVPVLGAYHVERSSRPESLDSLLYGMCLEAGVRFEFGRPLERGEVAALAPGTIIACGLNPPAYDMLGVPYIDWYAWQCRGEQENENRAWIWMDECINEYGYISYCNGIYYNLLFSYGREVDEAALERYRDFMRRAEGLEFDGWEYVHGAASAATADNPALLRNGLIMCGTMSGCLDPFMGFGISGALISGKIAATAVTQPEKAREEFDRFNRNFAKVFAFKHGFWYKLRERVDLLEGLAKILGPERSARLVIEGIKQGRKNSAIPGFSLLSAGPGDGQ